MNMQKLEAPKTGEAIFLRPERRVWDIRQAAKLALRDGLKPIPFKVAFEDTYDHNGVDEILGDEKKLKELARQLAPEISWSTDGAWNCAALWNRESRDGILLHMVGKGLLAAYLPLLDQETVEREHAVAMSLDALGGYVGDMPVLLEKGIPAGKWRLGEILERLSEDLEI